jgi:hypothetical protein
MATFPDQDRMIFKCYTIVQYTRWLGELQFEFRSVPKGWAVILFHGNLTPMYGYEIPSENIHKQLASKPDVCYKIIEYWEPKGYYPDYIPLTKEHELVHGKTGERTGQFFTGRFCDLPHIWNGLQVQRCSQKKMWQRMDGVDPRPVQRRQPEPFERYSLNEVEEAPF